MSRLALIRGYASAAKRAGSRSPSRIVSVIASPVTPGHARDRMVDVDVSGRTPLYVLHAAGGGLDQAVAMAQQGAYRTDLVAGRNEPRSKPTECR